MSRSNPGQPSKAPFIWGWDEITWFALLPEKERNDWLRSAWKWVQDTDANGHLQMPGSRVLRRAGIGPTPAVKRARTGSTPRKRSRSFGTVPARRSDRGCIARRFGEKRSVETRRRFYEMFVSDIVLQEARAGDPEMAAAREAALAGLPQLEQSPEADALAQRLLDMEIIPVKAAGDAAHVALAAVHGMDFLLTWNCQRPPALPLRAVLSHRLSRSARSQAYQQRGTQAADRSGLCDDGFSLPGDLHAE